MPIPEHGLGSIDKSIWPWHVFQGLLGPHEALGEIEFQLFLDCPVGEHVEGHCRPLFLHASDEPFHQGHPVNFHPNPRGRPLVFNTSGHYLIFPLFAYVFQIVIETRELPGVALVNI